MKLKVEKSGILDGLQKVQAIVNPRNTLPVLSNILLKAEGKELYLSATDLEVSVRTAVEADVMKPGASTVNARRIASIVRELPDHQVEITVDERDVAAIKCGASFFKLVGISEEDFPPIPKFDGGQTYELNQGVFREMLQKTSYAASTDDTMAILNGVLLTFKGDRLVVVATDGRRLALVEQELEFPEGAETELVVPSKTVNELLRTLRDEGSLKIQVTEKQVAFEFGSMLIVSKLVEGKYPNFKQVIPSECEERVTVERESLLTAVKRVSLVTSDQANTIKLVFGKNKLEVKSEAPDIGEAKESVPIKYAGKEVTVAFNPEFLMAPLRNLDSDEVHLELTDELSPGVIKSDVPFLYVLMPMRLT